MATTIRYCPHPGVEIETDSADNLISALQRIRDYDPEVLGDFPEDRPEGPSVREVPEGGGTVTVQDVCDALDEAFKDVNTGRARRDKLGPDFVSYLIDGLIDRLY